MQKPEKKETTEKHVVQVPFRDADDFSIKYEVGDDVSHFSNERKEELISRNIIKPASKKA